VKILLTGRNGQVGWELKRTLLPLGEVIAMDRAKLDLTDPESLRRCVRETEPDVIVNAAAYTAVDKAEEEQDLAMAINATAPRIMAEEARKLGSLLVHYSTDFVFDGTKTVAYTEQDGPNPINAYGRSKLAGEQAIINSDCDYLIFRTSWVYSARGHNFLLTILKLALSRDQLNIIGDQQGAPTWARLIAEVTSHCLKQAIISKSLDNFNSGLYHLTSTGATTWHGFAQAIVSYAKEHRGIESDYAEIKSIATSDYPTPAERPANSRLAVAELESAFKLVMPNWEAALHLCMEDLA
jgi:dTDP-4-dehydrorhamnose reductase